jgi:hypothetical protein
VSKLPHRWWIPLALIPPVILFLLLPVSSPVWNLMPKLRFLQFPWRWLVALEAPMAIFFAAAIWPAAAARRWLRNAVLALCTVFFLAVSVLTSYTLLTTTHTFFQPCDDEDAVAGMLDAYSDGAGFAGTDEYAPPGFDHSRFHSASRPDACLAPAFPAMGLYEVGIVPVKGVEQTRCEAAFAFTGNNPEHLHIAAHLARPGDLILRLFIYPAWRVRVNGQPVTPRTEAEDPLMVVPAARGAVDLTVDWTATPDVWAGRWLSVLALILLAALCFLERKLSRRGLS